MGHAAKLLGLTRAPLIAVLLGALAARGAAAPVAPDAFEAAARRPVAEGKVAGLSFCVSRAGSAPLCRGYGFADLENRAPATPDTVYAIASITKTFTAAAVLKLAEAGRLSLDDEVGRFLPDYPEPGRHATVRQLLSHTSGIRNMTSLGPRYWGQIGKDVTPEEIIRLFRDEPPEFPAGTRYAYSNSGYVLLGAILEKASGLSYGEVLSREVIRPAALAHTLYGGTDALVPARSRGTTRRAGAFVNAPHVSPTQGFSVGGILSTAPDLVAWFRALASGRVVSPDSFRAMTTPATLPDGSRLSYGYGIGVGDFAGHRVLFHAGGIAGFDEMLTFYPGEDVVIAVLCNTDGDEAALVENALARLALNVPAPADPPVPAEERAALVGRYVFHGATLEVRETGERLEILGVDDERPVRLLAQGKRLFQMQARPEVVAFSPEEGRASELRVTHFGATRLVATRPR